MSIKVESEITITIDGKKFILTREEVNELYSLLGQHVAPAPVYIPTVFGTDVRTNDTGSTVTRHIPNPPHITITSSTE